MGEHDDVSGGFSSIPRSDLKIGGNELDGKHELNKIRRVNSILNSGNTGHASKGIENANEISQAGRASQSFVKEGMIHKTELLLGQEVKPSSSKAGLLNTDVDCEKGALVKRNDAESVAQKRSGLSVSSCLNDDLSSVCSSRRRDKSSSTDVYSECGSSNVPVEEKDPMKLWKAMKQNGFLSNPHGGISVTSSSCVVSSSHGGIPAPRKRGRKSRNNDAATVKKRKIEVARKEEVDRFARLGAPSGLLNELNPGIINHVRNKKQVLSIIESIVKSDKDSGNFYHPSMRHSKTAVGGSRRNLADVNTDASRSDFSQGFKYAMPEDNYSMRYYEEKCTDGGELTENASSLSSEDTADLNCASVLTVKAATVASQWLELLHQDIKGRVSALRRSKKRVRAVVTTELPFLIRKEFPADQENDPNLLLNGASRASTVDIHKTRWIALFNQLEQTLSEEEKQLESWLNQVRELQSHCDRGLQHLSLSSGQNFLQLGMPLYSRASDALITDKDLVVRAAAASIYSTCNFLASKENITCT
ncbi:hypothetical protein EUTSA_v10013224mg [Eutrema salsugineum]|uniref:Uncharacterized protein n=1 Tax=Eutrema salsugineum TaxID=72664 RepID=V4L9T4_EUTSA|nr:uncharacterized protein LOC18019552 [Eutrema salsugineum]ESQ40439.1 hypothetical protein EUTSA_v10013224mg [Eutrema salsugineum]